VHHGIFQPSVRMLDFRNGTHHDISPRFIPGVAWSDHHSFWCQGYPAVMVTDTAFYRYRHYHAPTDTPEKLAYPELTQVTLGLFKAFAVLAREGVG
jgi:hypothetical protein